MSYKQKEPFVHPFTFFLVQAITTSYENTIHGKLTDSLEAIYWLTAYLDSKEQERLEKTIKTIEDTHNGSLTLTRSSFRNIISAVMKDLHGEGYFLAAKTRPPTREKSMKDIEMEVAIAKYGDKK